MSNENLKIEIVRFVAEYQAEVDEFMSAIEHEFAEPISTATPNTKNITTMAMDSTNTYWVALADGKAIGTLGLTMLANDAVVLTRVFLAKAFRGTGVAQLLLEGALEFAKQNAVETVCLGTTNQFKAAHRFYEKNGFKKIESGDLPLDFPLNPVDSVFYKLMLPTSDRKSSRCLNRPRTEFFIEISAATVTDAEISNILRRAYVDGGFTSPELALEKFRPADVRDRGHLICARSADDGTFAGMVIVVSANSHVRRLAAMDEAEIQLLAVDTPYQGCGLGRLLVKEATNFVREQGLRKIVLWTQTTMTKAQRLYESEGFVRAADRDPVIDEKHFLAYDKRW